MFTHELFLLNTAHLILNKTTKIDISE